MFAAPTNLVEKYDNKATGTFDVPWEEACADVAALCAISQPTPLVESLRVKYRPGKQSQGVMWSIVADDVCLLIDQQSKLSAAAVQPESIATDTNVATHMNESSTDTIPSESIAAMTEPQLPADPPADANASDNVATETPADAPSDAS